MSSTISASPTLPTDPPPLVLTRRRINLIGLYATSGEVNFADFRYRGSA
jgi:hypothetical protein